jgi:uncharacterized protein YndB with AHSA1/START domain
MMTETSDKKTDAGPLDLMIARIVDAPRALIWEAWTTPEHLMRWWAPKPWTTPECRIDLRPGGEFYTLMRGPDGAEHGIGGCYLEIVTRERIVFTDTLLAGWRPAASPFLSFTAIITLEDHQGGTKYTARVLHKTEEDRAKHEEMGFHDGWNTAIDQLIEIVKAMQGKRS